MSGTVKVVFMTLPKNRAGYDVDIADAQTGRELHAGEFYTSHQDKGVGLFMFGRRLTKVQGPCYVCCTVCNFMTMCILEVTLT